MEIGSRAETGGDVRIAGLERALRMNPAIVIASNVDGDIDIVGVVHGLHVSNLAAIFVMTYESLHVCVIMTDGNWSRTFVV